MADTKTEQKVVTLDSLDALVKKIKQDYATNESVDEKIEQIVPPEFEYATEEDILALFEDGTAEGKESNGSTTVLDGDAPADDDF